MQMQCNAVSISAGLHCHHFKLILCSSACYLVPNDGNCSCDLKNSHHSAREIVTIGYPMPSSGGQPQLEQPNGLKNTRHSDRELQ